MGAGPGVRSAGHLRPVGGGTAALLCPQLQSDCFGSGKSPRPGGPPSVSDYQLTALHALRNEAGRLVHDGQNGAPWYRRFGLDHHQQLLDAVLPWYGVANHRLIRDPANAALQQALNALVNSAPNSDLQSPAGETGL